MIQEDQGTIKILFLFIPQKKEKTKTDLRELCLIFNTPLFAPAIRFHVYLFLSPQSLKPPTYIYNC